MWSKLRRVVLAQRRLLLFLASVSAAIALLQAVSGGTQLAFYAAPLLVLVGIILSGRVPGEKWILARRAAAQPRRARPARRRWARARDRALTSLLLRSPRQLRGPPAAAFAVCR